MGSERRFFINCRHHYVRLFAGFEFGGDPFVDFFAVTGGGGFGEDGLAAGGEFVDDGDVEVAEGGHGEGARDGGGGHDESVRREAGAARFGADERALFDAEFVLFVDDDEGEGFELDGFGEEGVGADDEGGGAVGDFCESAFAVFAGDGAGEEGDLDFFSFEEVGEGDEVLFGEDFGGGHEGGLMAAEVRSQK